MSVGWTKNPLNMAEPSESPTAALVRCWMLSGCYACAIFGIIAAALRPRAGACSAAHPWASTIWCLNGKAELFDVRSPTNNPYPGYHVIPVFQNHTGTKLGLTTSLVNILYRDIEHHVKRVVRTSSRGALVAKPLRDDLWVLQMFDDIFIF